MKCSGCHFENPLEALFCMKCGTKMERKCPHCQSEFPEEALFCMKCGKRLVAEGAPPKDLSFDEKLQKIQRYLPEGLTKKILSQRDRIEGERKQVTVMFCDMEGYTILSEKLGSEEAYSIMDQVYEILIHKVHDFGGTVNEMTGDGILALFGAPIALEDAPQRAMRSALAIHREIVKFSDQINVQRQIKPIRMRIGIHTGPVVVGTVGNDLRVEFKAVGDTVNIASRIEGIAEPGTTYTTEDTFKLTEGLFRFEGLGERDIKGKEKPVKIYRVLAPSSNRTRFDVSSEQGLTPLVGRDRELELLLDGYERAKSGRGQAFSVVAEAGLGKSRLLYEFRKAIANENITFLEGKCLSYSRDAAYHPVIDILKLNFNIFESDSDYEIIEKVKAGLKRLEVDESSTLPYFLELLSVKDGGFGEIAISSEARKLRTLESLRRIVLKGAERRPLIMAVEDLHWVDKSSGDFFKFLLEGIPGARILLIFTYRPEFIHTWGGKSYHNQLNLNRLSNRESLAMLSHLLSTENIDKNIEALVLEKTEGVPFFIEEFVRSLRDLSMIDLKNGTYIFSENLNSLAIPSRIQDVIMARVDSLPEGAKEVLQMGSAIGREFSHELLGRLERFSEKDLLSPISILKDTELLYEQGIYPQSTYIFKHALTQETVYQSLIKKNRQNYHQEIAKALEEYFPDMKEVRPEILSHHFTEAGFAEKAIIYWQKAGEIALRRSANIEALSHMINGIELLKTLPESDKRMKWELEILISMGPPLIATKGWASPEAEKAYSRARELCDQIGTDSQRFPVLRGLWNFYNVRADYQTATELSEKLMDIAQNQQDKPYLLGAHRAFGADLFWLGKFSKSKHHQEQVITIYDPSEHENLAFVYWTDPKIHSLSYMGLILWLLGFPSQASQKSNEAIAMAHELSHLYSMAIALFFSTWRYYMCKDLENTKTLSETVIRLAFDQKFPIWSILGKAFYNWATGLDGTELSIISEMNQTLSEHQATGMKQMRPCLLSMLSDLYRIMGYFEESLKTVEEAIILVDKTGEYWWYAEINRLKGECLIAQSPKNQIHAESCYQKALEVARKQQAKSLELRSAMSMSRLWQSQGKIEDAHNLLSKIYSWFTEKFDTPDLKEAKALLEELS